MDDTLWLRSEIVERLRQDPQGLTRDELEDCFIDAKDEIERLRRDQAHSLGCEHHVDPPHRCTEGTCYRQWQADEIAQLLAERDGYRQALAKIGDPFLAGVEGLFSCRFCDFTGDDHMDIEDCHTDSCWYARALREQET